MMLVELIDKEIRRERKVESPAQVIRCIESLFPRPNLPTTSLRQLADAKRAAAKVSKDLHEALSLAGCKEERDYYGLANRFINTRTRLYKELEHYRSTKAMRPVTTLSEELKELVWLNREYGLRFTEPYRVAFMFKDVVYRAEDYPEEDLSRDVDLGTFALTATINQNGSFALYAFPLKRPALVSNPGSEYYVHPHVRDDSSVCLGAAYSVAVKALKERRWVDWITAIRSAFYNYFYEDGHGLCSLKDFDYTIVDEICRCGKPMFLFDDDKDHPMRMESCPGCGTRSHALCQQLTHVFLDNNTFSAYLCVECRKQLVRTLDARSCRKCGKMSVTYEGKCMFCRYGTDYLAWPLKRNRVTKYGPLWRKAQAARCLAATFDKGRTFQPNQNVWRGLVRLMKYMDKDRPMKYTDTN